MSQYYSKLANGSINITYPDKYVGIGTTNPTALLHVKGDNKAILLSSNDYDLAILTPRGSGSSHLDAGFLGLKANGVYKIALDTAGVSYFTGGNVGIGTTNPFTKLQVANTLGIYSTDTTTGGQIYLGSSDFYNANYYNSAPGIGAVISTGCSQPNGLGFYTYTGSANSRTEVMRIENNGWVGIGTTDPSQMLHVDGRAVITSDLIVGKDIGATLYAANQSTFNETSIVLDGDDDVVGLRMTALRTTGASTYEIWADSTALHFDTMNSGRDFVFNSQGGSSDYCNQVWIMQPTGNVGIGTTNPISKLHVSSTSSSYLTIQNTTNAGCAGLNLRDESGTDQFKLFYDLGNNASCAHINGNGLTLYSTQVSAEIAKFGLPTNYTAAYFKGCVGIGTTSPGGLLHLQSDGGNACGSYLLLKHANNNNTDIVATIEFANNLGKTACIQSGTTGHCQSGYMSFSTELSGSASEVMRITEDSNVGIGKTNPGSRLSVDGVYGINVRPGTAGACGASTAINNLLSLTMPYGPSSATCSNAGARVGVVMRGSLTDPITGDGQKTAAIYGVSEDVLGYSRKMGMALYTSSFDTNAAERVRIDADGNVGIGTTDPSQKLHVHNGRIAVTDGYNIGDTDANTGMLVSNDYFYVQTAGTTRMTVASNGKVGIGTASPVNKLNVCGSIGLQTSQCIGSGSIFGVTGAASWAALELYNASNGFTSLNNQNYGIHLCTNSSPRLTIKQDGTVGIGTTSPTTKLYVNGLTTLGAAGKTEGGAVINYASFGEIKGGAQTLLGNAVVPGTANNTIQHTKSDAGNFIRMVYSCGISFHTNITCTVNTDVCADTNERLRISLDGSVGIGTVSPGYRLDVCNATTADSGSVVARIKGSNDSGLIIEGANNETATNYGPGRTGSKLILRNLDSTAGNYTLLANYNATGYVNAGISFVNVAHGVTGVTEGSIEFFTRNTTSNYTKQMTLSEDGALRLTQYGSCTFSGTPTHYLTVDSSGNVIEELISSGTPTGSGTTGYVPKWTGSVALGNSILKSNANNVILGGCTVSSSNVCLHISSSSNSYNPSILFGYWTGAYDSGMWRITSCHTASCTLAIEQVTSGSAATNKSVYIDSCGRVGIGTTNPSYKMDLYGDLRITNTPETKIVFRETIATDTYADRWTIGNDDAVNNAFVISCGANFNTPRLVVLDTGNVGIGITNPSNKLQVVGGATSVNLAVTGAGEFASNDFGTTFKTTNTSQKRSQIFFKDSADAITARVGNDIEGCNNAKLQFIAGSGSTPHMSILSGGNVGIGTTDPTFKLDVSGDARINDSGAANGTASQTMQVVNTTAGATSSYIYIGASSGTDWKVGKNVPGTLSRTNFDITTHADVFGLTVNTSGQVGIGMTNPTNPLEVQAAGDMGLMVRSTSCHSSLFLHACCTGTSGNYIRMHNQANCYWINHQYNGCLIFRPNATSTVDDQIYFNQSSYVGIGTEPGHKLHVVDTAATDIKVESTGANLAARFMLKTTTRDWRIGTHALQANNLWIYDGTAGAYRVAIDTSGNVGIGTTDPAKKLDVAGCVVVRGAGTCVANAGTGELQIGYGYGAPGSAGTVTRLAIQPYAHTGGPWKFDARDTSPNAYLDILYGSSNAVTILHDGSVGIGTTNPIARLDVKSSIIVRDTDSDLTHVHLQSNATEGVLRLRNGANWGFIARGSGNNPYIGAYSGGSLNIVGFTNADASTFNSALTIFDFANSRVGIGTTSPNSLLHVHSTGTCATFTNIAHFRSGPDANATGSEIFIGHQGNSRGLIIQGGRGGEGAIADDTAVAHFCLNRSGNAIPSTTQDHIMTFRQGGFVGIGTTEPGTNTGKLFVGTPPTTGSAAIAQFGGFIRTNYILTHDSNYGIHPNTTCCGSVGTSAGVYKCAHICKIIAYGGICPSDDGNRPLGGSTYRWSNVHTVCTTTGAIFESNLCTCDIGSCPKGSVVVWRDGKLQGTTQEYDHRVMGITAPDSDSPIVMGAEPILVTGDIEEGDPIVTSSIINHGMKGDRSCDLHGRVIGEALESGSGDSYTIMGMVRKF